MVRGPRKRPATGGPQPPAKVHTFVRGVVRRDRDRYILTVAGKHLVVNVEGEVPIGQTAHLVIMRDGTSPPTVKVDQAASLKARESTKPKASKAGPKKAKKKKKSSKAGKPKPPVVPVAPVQSSDAKARSTKKKPKQSKGGGNAPQEPAVRRCSGCGLGLPRDAPRSAVRCQRCISKDNKARPAPKPILGGLNMFNVAENRRAREAMERMRKILNRGNDPLRK